jgi:hypothetical protein
MSTLTVSERMAIMRAKKAEKQAAHINTPNDPTLTKIPLQTPEIWRFRVSLDDAEWLRLAGLAGVRLPRQCRACTSMSMSKWLTKLGFDMEWFQDHFGMAQLADWPKRNPAWGLRRFAGELLEEMDSSTQATT